MQLHKFRAFIWYGNAPWGLIILCVTPHHEPIEASLTLPPYKSASSSINHRLWQNAAGDLQFFSRHIFRDAIHYCVESECKEACFTMFGFKVLPRALHSSPPSFLTTKQPFVRDCSRRERDSLHKCYATNWWCDSGLNSDENTRKPPWPQEHNQEHCFHTNRRIT